MKNKSFLIRGVVVCCSAGLMGAYVMVAAGVLVLPGCESGEQGGSAAMDERPVMPGSKSMRVAFPSTQPTRQPVEQSPPHPFLLPSSKSAPMLAPSERVRYENTPPVFGGSKSAAIFVPARTTPAPDPAPKPAVEEGE